MKRLRLLLSLGALMYLHTGVTQIPPPTDPLVDNYIQTTWNALTRTHANLLEAMVDAKFPIPKGAKPILYVSQQENLVRIKHKLSQELPAATLAQIDIAPLPQNLSQIKQQGLLYLPYPYVVPGGRFTELYGWDSYFIILGLLQDGRVELAKNMVDDLIYEVQYYGKILNANRSYYLERSQPPLLTEMILAVYAHTHDKAWLAQSLPSIIKLYHFWTSPPHLDATTGLSRYYAFGNGPAPEVVSSENYYEPAKRFYRTQTIHAYAVKRFYNAKTDTLTPDFYKNDRSMRESGFDISDKYGPMSALITDFVSVDLNTLLYQTELDTAHIYQILGQNFKSEHWQKLAEQRKERINYYFWDPALGLYFDYNMHTHRIYPYIFATTFYPLWAGIASQQQARRIVQNLPVFETQEGIVTSAYVTGYQWDAPYGWAPLQYFAVKGLARYGYCKEAERIAANFIRTVNTGFMRTHEIFEKYDLRASNAPEHTYIKYGYNKNQAGFGWTNGVYLELQQFLHSPKLWCMRPINGTRPSK